MSVTAHAALTPELRAVLEQGPSLFLTPRWLETLLAAYPRFNLTVFASEREGRVTAVLPFMEARRALWREAVSLPFGCHGGVVLGPGGTADDAHRLVRAFVVRARRLDVVRHELVALDPGADVRAALEASYPAREVSERTTWIVDLPETPEALWESYDTRLRRSIRRAREAGVTVAVARDAASLEAFYAAYAELSATWDLSWKHPLPALRTVLERMGDDAGLWLARHEGRVVAGELALCRPGREFLTWVPAATAASRELRARHLLIHELLEHMIRSGYRTFHFGPSAGREGLETFKEAFGATPRPLVHAGWQAAWVGWVQRVRW